MGTGKGRKKTTTKTTAPRVAAQSAIPRLIPQPNGRGALRAGGTPGNKGGTGRPPSAIRARLRGSYEARIPLLEQFADGRFVPAMPPVGEVLAKLTTGEDAATNAVMAAYAIGDRLRALDQMAKYGLGTTMTETDTQGNDVTVRVRREAKRAVG